MNGEREDWRNYDLLEEERLETACDCCAGTTITATGTIDFKCEHVALYYVRWTSGARDHGARFIFFYGPWGDAYGPADRGMAVVDLFFDDVGAPSFHLRDDPLEAEPAFTAAQQAIGRADVLDTNWRASFFAVLDAVYVRDTRLDEVRAW